jgi:hypothetical protein
LHRRGVGAKKLGKADDDRVLVELSGLKQPIGSLLMRRKARGRVEVSLDSRGHVPAHFYRSSAMELARQWHKLSDDPLPLISGDEALTFAVAFYSPDHPEYKRAWDPPDTPLPAILKKGWAAICFSDDKGCIAFINRSTPPIGFARSEFAVQSSLLGVPGASGEVTALLVRPED